MDWIGFQQFSSSRIEIKKNFKRNTLSKNEFLPELKYFQLWLRND